MLIIHMGIVVAGILRPDAELLLNPQSDAVVAGKVALIRYGFEAAFIPSTVNVSGGNAGFNSMSRK
jgi:hypothetical protein